MNSAPQVENVFHALAFALPSGDAAPEWITIFPKAGEIKTRDARTYHVDPSVLVSRFAADAVDVPVDVNHATAHAAQTGARADAVGWIKELRVEKGALQGRVEWLEEGRALLAAKKYRFVSPDFFHTRDGKPKWLRSVALVTAPALGNQQALASAKTKTHEDANMDKLAAALGVTAGANEDTMVAALGAGFVPKADADKALADQKSIGDKAVADLKEANAKLAAIETDARKAKVDGLIEEALKAKKILPAEKDHYAQLCATDGGFDSVKALLAARGVVLPGSGLDEKKAPEGDGGDDLTPAQLSAKAHKMVEAGDATDFIAAVGMLSAKQAA